MVRARGYCSAHNRQILRGVNLVAIRDRTEGPVWAVNQGGYVGKRSTENTGAAWILQHRAVMEEMLGRPLVKGENVHHINGVRDDNRPENLELWSTFQPAGQRVEDKLAWAHEIINRYGEAI
jgi:hypothetical protein